MVQEFKVRRTPIKTWVGVIVCILAVILMCIQIKTYYFLFSTLLPLLLLIDERMIRYRIQDNGEVWIRRGFSGTVRTYGIRRVVYRPKAWATGKLVIYYQRGFIAIDPQDVKEFIHCLRERNPKVIYSEE